MTNPEPRMEDAVWDAKSRRRHVSASTLLLHQMVVGQVKRIYHTDVQCVGNGGDCSLTGAIGRLRKRGWRCETYHEGLHIVVVRRLA